MIKFSRYRLTALGLILVGIMSYTLADIFNDKKLADAGSDAIPVQVAKVRQMGMPTIIFSVGTLIALKSADISSEVDGRIVSINYQNGDYVKQGATIIQLDDAKAKADLSSAQAALNLARTTYARYLALSRQGAVSQQDLDQKRSDLESQEAAVNAGMAALQQKIITAPFSGYLGEFLVTQGAYITAGQALVKLVDRDELKVQYSVPQKYLNSLKLNQTVKVKSDSYPDKVFYGEVTYISPTVDVATGSVTVQATISNKDGLLSPGMFVTIKQITQEDPQALVIPEQAIIAGLQGNTVFKIMGDKAYQIQVKVGEHRNGYAQILDGLNLGDRVVIAGQQKLQDGSLVSIIPSMEVEQSGSYIAPINPDDLSPANPSGAASKSMAKGSA